MCLKSSTHVISSYCMKGGFSFFCISDYLQKCREQHKAMLRLQKEGNDAYLFAANSHIIQGDLPLSLWEQQGCVYSRWFKGCWNTALELSLTPIMPKCLKNCLSCKGKRTAYQCELLHPCLTTHHLSCSITIAAFPAVNHVHWCVIMKVRICSDWRHHIFTLIPTSR